MSPFKAGLLVTILLLSVCNVHPFAVPRPGRPEKILRVPRSVSDSVTGSSTSISTSSSLATIGTTTAVPAASATSSGKATATNVYYDLSPDVWKTLALGDWLDDFADKHNLVGSANFLHEFTLAAGMSPVDYSLGTPTAPQYRREAIERLPVDEYKAYYMLQAFKVYNQWMQDLMNSFTDAMGDMNLALDGIINDWIDKRPPIPYVNQDVKLGQMLNSAAMVAFLIPVAPIQILGAVTIIVGSILEKQPDLLGPNAALNFDDFAQAGVFGDFLLNMKQAFRDSLTTLFDDSTKSMTTFKTVMRNGEWMQPTNIIENTDTVTNGFVQLWTQQIIAQIIQNQGVYLMRQTAGYDVTSGDSCRSYATSLGTDWFCQPDDGGLFHAYNFRISVANDAMFREYDDTLPYDPTYLSYTSFASPIYTGGTSKVGLDLGQLIKTSEEIFAINPYLTGSLYTPWDPLNDITLNPRKYLNSDVSSQWNVPICDIATMVQQCNWALRRELSTLSFIDPNNPACDDGANFRNRTGWFCDSMVNTFTYDKTDFRTVRVPADAWVNY